MPRHAAVVLGMGSRRWMLVDPRQFGRFGLGKVEGLGPEPMEDSFTAEDLAAGLAGSRQPVKTRLLDQSVVAGIGNIYASESLHRAGIRPARPAKSLKASEVARLHHALRHVLGEAIRLGRSLPLDFAGGADGLFYFGSRRDKTASDPSSTSGREATERWSVYDREGEACPRCGARIRRWMLGGRATFECRGCQR
jgi:formamidopyrimidine-DNA glycosylase